MGMAAGQARLLSITSRLSDNELRAQVISNNKMRLATQSSQASEKYVNALNKAQMMFTNYDADNNTSYQQLTFNALTAYNPYNNQYILSNASGQVVLSEEDATKYVKANGSVEAFLKSYGLEHTTSYFENLEKHVVPFTAEDDITYQAMPFKTGIINDDGTEAKGYFYAKKDYNAADLRAYIQGLYEGTFNNTYTNAAGNEVKLHPGYEKSIASEDNYNYTKALGSYIGAKDAYLETIAQLMSEKLEAIGSPNLNEIATNLSSITLDDSSPAQNVTTLSAILTNLGNIVDSAWGYKLSTDVAENYFDDLKNIIENNKGNYSTATCGPIDRTLGTISFVDDEGLVQEFTSAMATIKYIEDDTEKTLTITPTVEGGNYVYSYTDENGEEEARYEIPTGYFTNLLEDPTGENIFFKTKNTDVSMINIAKQVISSLRSSIYSVWNPTNAYFKPTSSTDWGYDEYQAYLKCGKELSEQIFGTDIGGYDESTKSATNAECYANLDDIEWCHGDGASNFANETKQNAFEKIYDIYILDCILNTYGEPKYAWINTNNPNENGDAKAQWYENLFKRIQKGGFTVLKDGLASSPEWIQFAFESGVVTMEQVDELKNWQPLIYSNCSDITQQTCDVEIARAEAEYKAAMNKIENKDKRYDMELKNIDTEHNSLQTEYDSIKTAIDKNIDRTFKLYM